MTPADISHVETILYGVQQGMPVADAMTQIARVVDREASHHSEGEAFDKTEPSSANASLAQLVGRAITAAVQALPPRWQRGEAQKEWERSDVEPIVRAALEASWPHLRRGSPDMIDKDGFIDQTHRIREAAEAVLRRYRVANASTLARMIADESASDPYVRNVRNVW